MTISSETTPLLAANLTVHVVDADWPQEVRSVDALPALDANASQWALLTTNQGDTKAGLYWTQDGTRWLLVLDAQAMSQTYTTDYTIDVYYQWDTAVTPDASALVYRNAAAQAASTEIPADDPGSVWAVLTPKSGGGGGATGTVTSVAAAVPSALLAVAGSPVTTSGTLAFSLVAQSPNLIFASPTTGGAATPSFRTLVATDIPNLDVAKITSGTFAPARLGTGTASATVYLAGNGTWKQIAYSELSGTPTIPAAQIQADWAQATTTAADFIKNKPTIPAAQIQADWAQANTAALDFIKNKPTIPAQFDAVNTLAGDALELGTTAGTNVVAGMYNRCTSATAVTVTVNTGVATVGQVFEVRQAGAGIVTFTAGAGVTINAPFEGLLTTAGEGATVVLKCVAAGVFDLSGQTGTIA
ncbi:hypothetical protein [Achromobacter phage Motura]|uniref:Uncharacterized protein n=1 Tax=Achromobacter phage Motura TaxID=2591403 RepID=A0A514CTA8_9CAUD|nr:tail fiber protein [Achromobacter phage Motura]QDH83702.1 hypothetical protein [Achromobacter phage Motura]